MIRITQRRASIGLLAGSLALMTIGCGKSGPNFPDNTQVSGKVVFSDGKPLTSGVIVFTPKEEGEEAPQAEIQPDGTFQFAEDGGIRPSEYQISLSQSENEEETEGEAKPASQDNRIPKKYRKPSTSGWTASVKESGNEPFTFTISTDKKKKN